MTLKRFFTSTGFLVSKQCKVDMISDMRTQGAFDTTTERRWSKVDSKACNWDGKIVNNVPVRQTLWNLVTTVL